MQRAPVYRLKVPLRFEFEDGSAKVLQVETNALQAPFRFESKLKVTTAQVDPRFEVLHFTSQTEAAAKALIPYTKANWMYFTGKTDESQKALEAALASRAGPDPYGLEFNLRLRLAQILCRAKNYADALVQADKAELCPGRDPLLTPTYYQLVMNCADKTGDLIRARWAAEACLAAEQVLDQHTGASRAAERWLAEH